MKTDDKQVDRALSNSAATLAAHGLHACARMLARWEFEGRTFRLVRLSTGADVLEVLEDTDAMGVERWCQPWRSVNEEINEDVSGLLGAALLSALDTPMVNPARVDSFHESIESRALGSIWCAVHGKEWDDRALHSHISAMEVADAVGRRLSNFEALSLRFSALTSRAPRGSVDEESAEKIAEGIEALGGGGPS